MSKSYFKVLCWIIYKEVHLYFDALTSILAVVSLKKRSPLNYMPLEVYFKTQKVIFAGNIFLIK